MIIYVIIDYNINMLLIKSKNLGRKI